MTHPLAPEQRQIGARDLAWLIASLALVVAPHALRAPWWLTRLTLCLYGWRMYFAIDRGPLPSRWLVLGVAAGAMLGVWIEFRTLFGRQPGILLLMLFSGLKLLETRTHRDAAITVFLGYFLVITNFLYTQSIPTAFAMALAVFVLTATLIGLAAPQRPTRANARTAALLLAHAAPAALAYALGMRGAVDILILVFFVSSGISRLARFNVTAANLSDESGKVRYYEGTPIPSSLILVALLAVCFQLGRTGDDLPLGTVRVAHLAWHPVSLVFFINGCTMISKTLKIPKI